MANCYNCGGAVRCAGRSGTGVQAEGRVCNLCGGHGRCQRRTNGQMREPRPVLARRLSLLAATMLAGLATPAWAECATSTSGGVTTLACDDTVTVDSTNTNGNNPSTNAQQQSFANGIEAVINAGRTISGFGLIITTGSPGQISAVNNGAIANTSGTSDPRLGFGLRLIGSGGRVSYSGRGNVTTTFAAPPAAGAAPTAGLSLENEGAGGIALGSVGAPVSGTFRGPDAISLYSNGSGSIDGFIDGGLLDAVFQSSLSVAGRGAINITTTGNTVMTGALSVDNLGGAPNPAFGINVATDARIGTSAAPVTNALRIGIGGTTGGTTNLNLTGTAAIFGNGNAIFIDRSASAPGAFQLTTAAGTSLNASGSPAFGINVQGRGAGAITLDLGGSITSALGGVLVATGDGPTNITIRSGATVSGAVNALEVRRAFGATGASETLVLGNLTSPNTAATFDGTLRIGNGGTSGTISGNIINDGQLIFNRSDPVTYAGIISGTGSLTKLGGSIATGLRLTGASTYSGSTTIGANALLTLGHSAAGLNGSIAGTSGIVNNGRLMFDQANAFTFDRQISGSGDVQQAGAGAVTITSAQSYTGGTLVTTTLRLGAGGAIASSSSVNLTDTVSELDIAAGGNQTVRELGGGGFVTLGSNTLTSLAGPGRAALYSGVIRGTGNLVIDGGGDFLAEGTNTFTGTTTVRAGALYVGVSNAASSLTRVEAGTVLGGRGTVGNTVVSGTLSPGSPYTATSIATLTINGNLTFNPGSTFRVEVGNSQATTDRIVVTGTASLAGGLTAIANGGTFSSGSYTLLTANGGISGTFTPFVTQGTPPNGASVALRYDPNNVFLDVQTPSDGATILSQSTRESLAFNSPTVTTNRVTNYSTRIIGRLLGGSPLYDQTFGAAFADPVVQAGITAARATITAAGGPGVIIGDPVRTASSTTSVTRTGASTFTLANTQTTVEPGVVTFGPATLEVGTLVTCNVAPLPSSTRPTCVNGATTLALGINDTNINVNTNIVYTIDETRTDTITDTLNETWELNGQVVAVGSVHAEVQSGLFDLSARLLQRLTGPMATNAGWAEGYAFRVAQSGTRRARGFAGGANLALGGGFSFAFGVDRGTLDIDLPGALESAGVELTEGGVALRYAGERFTAALSTTYGGGTAKTLRTIIGRSEARYGVKLAGIALDLGYGFATGGWQLRPVAGIEYLSLRTNGFTESDTLGLVVRGQRHSRTRASAGLEVARTWGRVQLAGSARYQTVLSGETRVVPVAFALAPARSLTMTGASEPDTALLNARLSVPVSSAAAVSFGYDGRFGTGYTTHSGVIGVSVAF